MISTELQILIECIKVVLLKKDKQKLIELLDNQLIDWKHINKMVAYHRIRPVVYEALRQVNFTNDFTEELANFSKKQAIKNLVDSQELTRVLSLLNQQNIQVLPYKGLLFLEKLYQNKPLREYNDIDIVVKPSDAPKAIQLLIKDGYVLQINTKTPNNEVTNDMLKGIPGREVGLYKTNKLGFNFYIDFHWDITGSYHQYTINIPSI